jgi:primase-polymerase (primpol)-like protein
MIKRNSPALAANVTEEFQSRHVPKAQDIVSISRKAKNGKAFLELFKNGDTSKYNGDDSSADMALCCMLAFWCGDNHALIDEVFRQSALYRDKWEREDYRTSTIEKAIAHQGNKFYNWEKRKKKQESHKKDILPVKILVMTEQNTLTPLKHHNQNSVIVRTIGEQVISLLMFIKICPDMSPKLRCGISMTGECGDPI